MEIRVPKMRSVLFGIAALLVLFFVAGGWQAFFWGDRLEDPYLEVPHEGAPFAMGPATQEVRVPFELDASVAAIPEETRVRFVFDVDWLGVPELERSLTATILDAGGVPVDTDESRFDVFVSCGAECFGGGLVIVTWPDHLDHGAVTIEWDGEAKVSYRPDRSFEEHSLDFLVEDPDATPSLVVGGGEIAAGPAIDGKTVARHRLEIMGADPAAEYWIEVPMPPRELRDATADVYVVTHSGPVSVDTNAHPVQLPLDCLSSCTTAIDLVLDMRGNQGQTSASMLWSLIQIGGSAGASVTSSPQPIPSITMETMTMGTVRDNTEAGSGFTWVRLSSEAMSIGDFAMATPHAIVTFRHLGADHSEDLPDSVEMTLVLHLPNELGTFSVEESVAGSDILGSHSIDGPIAGRCDEDKCLLAFGSGRGFEGFERGVIDVSSLTTVELFFPFAEEVPNGAELLLAG